MAGFDTVTPQIKHCAWILFDAIVENNKVHNNVFKTFWKSFQNF